MDVWLLDTVSSGLLSWGHFNFDNFIDLTLLMTFSEFGLANSYIILKPRA